MRVTRNAEIVRFAVGAIPARWHRHGNYVECFDRLHLRVGWPVNLTNSERQPSTPSGYGQYPRTSRNAVLGHQS